MSLPTIPFRRTTANGPHMGSQISFTTPDWHCTLEDIQTHLTQHRVLCLALLASALALALVLGPLRRRPTHPPQTLSPSSPRALVALQHLLVPARSRWPEPYTALAARADARASRTLSIPLAVLLRDLLAGTVELRHPARSLHALFAGAEPDARGDAWRVRVVADVGLWARVLARIARERVFPAPFDVPTSAFSLAAREDDLPPSPWNDNDDDDGDGDQRRPHSPLPALAPHPSFTLDLDAVPPTELESLLHHLHAALPANPRATLTLGLTTLGAHLSPLALDPSFVLAAVPFLPPPPPPPPPRQKQQQQQQQQQQQPARTSLALTASLPGVLSHLQQAHLALLSATHVSDGRAAALRRAQAAARTPHDARACVLAAWEAALLEQGLLRRWTIVVQKEG